MPTLRSIDNREPTVLSSLEPLQEVGQLVRRNWGWFVGLGVLMIAGGIFACIAAVTSTIVTVYFVGWFLILGGIAQIIHSFAVKGFGGVVLNLLAGALYLVAGCAMLRSPGMGAVALTLLLGAMFIMNGLDRAIVASSLRFPKWGWLVASGIISFFLGVIVWASLPSIATWLLGFYVGIDLITLGWWYAYAGFAVKSEIPLEQPERAAA